MPRNRPNLLSLIAVATAVLACVGFQLVAVSPASAAVVRLPGCQLTNSDGAPIDWSEDIDTDDPRLEQYADGSYLSVHDWAGPIALGEPDNEDVIPPVCAVQVHRDGASITFGPPTWLWCTDIDAHACAAGELGEAASVLTPGQERLIGWVLRTFEDSGATSQDELYNAQNRIWCITDGRSGIEQGAAVGPYLPGHPEVTSCDEYLGYLNAEIAPNLVDASSTLTLSAPTDADVATVATVTVASSLASVRLQVSGAGSLELCPGQDGASLDVEVLHLAPGAPTELCATSPTEGVTTVHAGPLVSGGVVGTQFSSSRPGCQVFITSDISNRTIDDDVQINWTVTPETTTSTTSTTTTTVPESTTTSTTSTTTTTVPESTTTSTTTAPETTTSTTVPESTTSTTTTTVPESTTSTTTTTVPESTTSTTTTTVPESTTTSTTTAPETTTSTTVPETSTSTVPETTTSTIVPAETSTPTTAAPSTGGSESGSGPAAENASPEAASQSASNGGLPRTGTDTGPLVGIALALLTLGAAAIGLRRLGLAR